MISHASDAPKALLATTLVVTLASSCSLLGGQDAPPPRELRPIGEFELIDHRAKPFGSKELAGKPYVISFFFTSCPTICPKIQGAMLKLQAGLEADGSDCQLVSVTVDPENDTPSRLASYAKELGADLGRWTMLTGEPEKVLRSIRHSFVTHVGEPETTEEGLMDIGHGGHLILVDGQGVMRGTYEAAEPASQARILADLRALR